jgi:CBS domain-containing protein
VAEIMTGPPLLVANEDDELDRAEALMARERKSRVLVVDSAGRCVGVLNGRDWVH